jgi:hypothetical protein
LDGSYYRGCWHELSPSFLLGSVNPAGEPTGTSSPTTAVYNPKAFIPHAASLGQACAHCRRFSTAATRRCLGSVSVPVTRVVLSHPLPIFALVGRYPTNKLIGPRPLPRWNHTFGPETLSGITGSFPPLSQTRGYVSRYYCPLRRFPCIATDIARLACLIHAANVHSEPGSNPSIDVFISRPRTPCDEPG